MPRRKKTVNLSEVLSEAAVQKSVIDYLRLRNYMVIRINSGSQMFEATATTKRRFVRFNSMPGCSDLIICQPITGKFGAIEVKRPDWKPPSVTITDRQTGKPKPNPDWAHHKEQMDFLCQVEDKGGMGFFARSLDDVIAKLACYENRAVR